MPDVDQCVRELSEQLAQCDRRIAEALERRVGAAKSLRAALGATATARLTVLDSASVAELATTSPSFPVAALRATFHEIACGTEAAISPPLVAFLGPAGSFAHVAARSHFGAAARFEAAESISAALEDVARGRYQAAVVPMWSDADGLVTATLESLLGSELRIAAERVVVASYSFASRTGNAGDVEKVYGTAQSFAACQHWVGERFPKAQRIEVKTAPLAAQLAADDHGAAVLATSVIVEAAELKIIVEHAEDPGSRETRFVVVSEALAPRSGTDRTCLALAVSDGPGALHGALESFADRGVNLTALESRPARGESWRYVFYVELDGHITDRALLTAIEELRTRTRFVKVLGSYPKPA